MLKVHKKPTPKAEELPGSFAVIAGAAAVISACVATTGVAGDATVISACVAITGVAGDVRVVAASQGCQNQDPSFCP